MKNSLKILAAALLAYGLLILFLVKAESGMQGASIHSVGDALWFSLETVTTVGYGDLAPVSTVGKIISSFFAVCSIGIFSALIGVAVSMFHGNILPSLYLRFHRKKEWYIFSEENVYSVPLALELSKYGIVIFQNFMEDRPAIQRNIITLNASALQIQKWKNKKQGEQTGLSFFEISKNRPENLSRALELSETGVKIYCMSEQIPENLPLNVKCFSETDCVSRSYWSRYPLQKQEGSIVLIGCDSYGRSLLERALLTNVFEVGRVTTYHIFGDASEFRAMHRVLVNQLERATGEDKLVFHPESWKECPDLMQSADRIIFCGDEENENYSAYCTLKELYVVPGRVFVRMKQHIPGAESFGEIRSFMKPQIVIHHELDNLAERMNHIYNKSSASPQQWEELSEFARKSNIAAADHIPVKVRYLLDKEDLTEMSDQIYRKAYQKYKMVYPDKKEELEELEHRRWMRFHYMYNWQYAPKRNNTMRMHPLLVPFSELSENEKRKDDFAWEILSDLSM